MTHYDRLLKFSERRKTLQGNQREYDTALENNDFDAARDIRARAGDHGFRLSGDVQGEEGARALELMKWTHKELDQAKIYVEDQRSILDKLESFISPGAAAGASAGGLMFHNVARAWLAADETWNFGAIGVIEVCDKARSETNQIPETFANYWQALMRQMTELRTAAMALGLDLVKWMKRAVEQQSDLGDLTGAADGLVVMYGWTETASKPSLTDLISAVHAAYRSSFETWMKSVNRQHGQAIDQLKKVQNLASRDPNVVAQPLVEVHRALVEINDCTERMNKTDSSPKLVEWMQNAKLAHYLEEASNRLHECNWMILEQQETLRSQVVRNEVKRLAEQYEADLGIADEGERRVAVDKTFESLHWLLPVPRAEGIPERLFADYWQHQHEAIVADVMQRILERENKRRRAEVETILATLGNKSLSPAARAHARDQAAGYVFGPDEAELNDDVRTKTGLFDKEVEGELAALQESFVAAINDKKQDEAHTFLEKMKQFASLAQGDRDWPTKVAHCEQDLAQAVEASEQERLAKQLLDALNSAREVKGQPEMYNRLANILNLAEQISIERGGRKLVPQDVRIEITSLAGIAKASLPDPREPGQWGVKRALGEIIDKFGPVLATS